MAAVHQKLDGNLQEVSYRPLRRSERAELEAGSSFEAVALCREALHQEWFPVAYAKSFYDEVFEKKSLHSMAAVVSLALIEHFSSLVYTPFSGFQVVVGSFALIRLEILASKEAQGW